MRKLYLNLPFLLSNQRGPLHTGKATFDLALKNHFQSFGKFISAEPVQRGPDGKMPDSRMLFVMKIKYEKGENTEALVIAVSGESASLVSVGEPIRETKSNLPK